MSLLTESIAALKADFVKGRRDFSFEYVTMVGKRMGSIPESETRLVVQGIGIASLFRRRGPGDSADRSPGRYLGSLSDESILSFLDILETSGIESFHSEIPGPRDPVAFLRVLISGRLFSFTWGSLRPPTPEPMMRLKQLLADWSIKACPDPVWSLEMSVANFQSMRGKITALISVKNRGTEDIHLCDPASASFGSQFAFYLKYGERQHIEEGITPAPIEIHTAHPPQRPDEPARFVRVSPGQPWTFDFSGELEGEATRGWTGKFSFLHYLPADFLAGVPVFSGALFTKEFAW